MKHLNAPPMWSQSVPYVPANLSFCNTLHQQLQTTPTCYVSYFLHGCYMCPQHAATALSHWGPYNPCMSSLCLSPCDSRHMPNCLSTSVGSTCCQTSLQAPTQLLWPATTLLPAQRRTRKHQQPLQRIQPKALGAAQGPPRATTLMLPPLLCTGGMRVRDSDPVSSRLVFCFGLTPTALFILGMEHGCSGH